MPNLNARNKPKTHALAASLLCLLLPGQMLPAQAPASNALPAKVKVLAPSLSQEQRELHVLNRFTFGPIAEDETAIHQLGIDKWFESQLFPSKLPLTTRDQILSAHLADFPAMQLPVDQLVLRFPTGGITRQVLNGKFTIPDDPLLATVYRHQVDLLVEKDNKKNEAQQAKTHPQPAAVDSMAVAAKIDSGVGAMTGSAASGGDMAMNAAQPAPAAKPADQPRPAYTDVLLNSLLSMPPAERFNRILSMKPGEYEPFRNSLKGPEKLELTQDMTGYQRELLADWENPTKAIIDELQSQRLLRDIYSSHQLEEVMTTFWLNHFNIFLHKNGETPYYMVSYERDVIRPRALGNFENLLIATAESPAMTLYLDNASSTGPDSIAAEKQKIKSYRTPVGAKPVNVPGLNENYARELMELHTLGVNGGYTQKDVTEVAKVFTGWTVENQQHGGGFVFDPNRHQPGVKTVLGEKIKEDGYKEGLEVLHMLANSPATAHFISQELAIQFVSDTPPPALVERMAQAFLRTHGDIPTVLRTMLHSAEFWSTDAYQAKVKTPLEYVVSAARTSGAEITNTQPLVNALNQMGMPLYDCVVPTGYSAKTDAWVSTGALVTRMNFGLTLATNHYQGIQLNWTSSGTDNAAAPMAMPAPDPSDEEQRLEALLVPTGVSDRTRAAVLAQITQGPQQPGQGAAKPAASMPVAVPKPANAGPATHAPAAAQKAAQPQPSPAEKQDATLAGLLIGSPEFQRR